MKIKFCRNLCKSNFFAPLLLETLDSSNYFLFPSRFDCILIVDLLFLFLTLDTFHLPKCPRLILIASVLGLQKRLWTSGVGEGASLGPERV